MKLKIIWSKVPQQVGGGSMSMLSPHVAPGTARSVSVIHSRNPSTSSMLVTHHRPSHATSKSCHSSMGVPHSGMASRFRWFGWLLRGAYRYEIEDTVIMSSLHWSSHLSPSNIVSSCMIKIWRIFAMNHRRGKEIHFMSVMFNENIPWTHPSGKRLSISR